MNTLINTDIEYYDNNQIKKISYKLYNENEPAVIHYYKNEEQNSDINGSKYCEEYWTKCSEKYLIIYYYKNGNKEQECHLKNGKKHKKGGPAVIDYYENGNVKEKWFYKNGKLHNSKGPAVIRYSFDGNIIIKVYWKNGELHRENDPAVIEYSSDGIILRKEYA